MSVKKQIQSSSILYSIQKEDPVFFLDETDVDCYFNHNICEVYQSHHRIVRVSRGSNKNKIATKFFAFCDIKTQQRYILKDEISISRKKIVVLLNNLRDFLKPTNKPTNPHRSLFRDPKSKLTLDCQQTTTFVAVIKTFENIPTTNSQIRFFFVSNKTTSVSFPS